MNWFSTILLPSSFTFPTLYIKCISLSQTSPTSSDLQQITKHRRGPLGKYTCNNTKSEDVAWHGDQSEGSAQPRGPIRRRSSVTDDLLEGAASQRGPISRSVIQPPLNNKKLRQLSHSGQSKSAAQQREPIKMRRSAMVTLGGQNFPVSSKFAGLLLHPIRLQL